MARNTITRYERGFLPTIPKTVERRVSSLTRADSGEQREQTAGRRREASNVPPCELAAPHDLGAEGRDGDWQL